MSKSTGFPQSHQNFEGSVRGSVCLRLGATKPLRTDGMICALWRSIS